MVTFFGIILIVVAVISTLLFTVGVLEDDTDTIAVASFVGIVVELVAGILLLVR